MDLLEKNDSPITKEDKIRALKREIDLRRKVYPRWVARGSMSEGAANREIAVMTAILEDYKK